MLHVIVLEWHKVTMREAMLHSIVLLSVVYVWTITKIWRAREMQENGPDWDLVRLGACAFLYVQKCSIKTKQQTFVTQ